MPFTTLPAFTSRHAMMRLARVSQCTEILQDLQAHVARFLRMELHAEQVPPLRRRGKGHLIGAGCYRVATHWRAIRMSEIHIRPRRNATQQPRARIDNNAVPTHVRRLYLV